ncbi:LysR family transcriptional regulator [Pelagibius litoralis]|uniref:LysR family transcriptional regulator n=1 Tax=Pelagibius litoralis TaxID=374515 RepID=A0A967C1Y0_9PROT|nr:LysR substrate-binding domain-containing protein [Pelagibius litoralis]NIA67328.1 LysR family transcriptional regulator [Pelagibius litoralis]
MRYVQLRAFHYVAVCGGFSRAAEALCLTQPAISDQVRKLEEEYDVILFNRHKKQVSLTSAGQRLLEISHRMFEVEKQALELLSESRALRAESLRVVADSAHHMLHILGRFRERYPDVGMVVSAGNSEEVIAQLYDYEAEIGILGEMPKGRDFETIKLSSTPLIAFTNTEHPLSKRKKITLAELCDQFLVLRERGSKTRQSVEAAAQARGLKLKPAIEAEGREAVREIVATSGGVGVVSSAEFGQDPRLVPIRLSDCELLMDEALVCLRERAGGKVIRAFFETAREVAAAG